jgi:hypothetical protein
VSDKPQIVLLADEIAENLPEGWWSAPRPKDGYLERSHYILGPDDTKLSVCVHMWGAQKGRLEISGCFDYHAHVSSPSPRTVIHVDGDRPAKVIAREIVRRLLPGYLSQLAVFRGQVHEFEAERSAQSALLAKLVASVRVQHMKPDDGRASIRFAGAWEYSEIGLKVSRSSEGSTVEIEVDHMKPEQALAFMKWARSHLGYEGASD